MPSTPSAVVIGAWVGSSLRSWFAGRQPWVAQPTMPKAKSPGLKCGLFDAITSPTAPASMVPPTGTGAA